MTDTMTMNDTTDMSCAVYNAVPPDYWSNPASAALYNASLNTTTINMPRVDPGTTIDLVRAGVDNAVAMRSYSIDDLQDADTAIAIRNYVLDQAASIGGFINNPRDKSKRIPLPQQKMTVEYGCAIIIGTGDVARVRVDFSSGDDDADQSRKYVLAYYSHRGDLAGVWTPINSDNKIIIERIMYHLGVSTRAAKDSIHALTSIAPEIKASHNMHLFPLADGVLEFDGTTRIYTPYLTPDGDPNPTYEDLYGRNACLMHKCRAHYRPGMPEPTFKCADGFEWSPLKGLTSSVNDNKDAVTAILQSISFAMRGTSGGYSFWYMDGSENGKGGGGKSTAAYMIGAVIGESNVSHLKINEIADDDFTLGSIVGKTAIIGHETTAGQKAIKATDNVKSLMRGDPVMINEKYRDKYPYAFHGLWVQCMNTDSPKFSEKEAALYRLIVPIYFPKTYTDDGDTHRAINDKYARSVEVADYLANYVLDTYGDLQAYDSAAIAVLRNKVADIRSASSVTYSFLDEYMPDAGNLDIPINQMYKFCNQWADNNGYHAPNLKTFKSDIMQWCAMRGGWHVETYDNPRRKSSKWILDRWITENPVIGSTNILANGKITITDSLQCCRTRDWLIREDSNDVAKYLAESEDEEAHRLRHANYQAYRAGCAYLAAFILDSSSGLDINTLVMPYDAWKALGQPLAGYNADGTMSLMCSAGKYSKCTFDVPGYVRVMRAYINDPSALYDRDRFASIVGLS